jgi:hypothetical protein
MATAIASSCWMGQLTAGDHHHHHPGVIAEHESHVEKHFFPVLGYRLSAMHDPQFIRCWQKLGKRLKHSLPSPHNPSLELLHLFEHRPSLLLENGELVELIV